MAHFTFRGGIELQEHKERTKNLAIQEILPGRKLVFPMKNQEKSMVVPGEYVLSGQLLARSEAGSMSRIHSSVSGIVKAIEKRMTACGEVYESIIVENDEKYKEADFGDFVEADDLENRQILARILSAGVYDSVSDGMVYEKLNVKEPQKIRHVIVNCAESEPYLTSKNRLAAERPEWIIEGLRILLKLFPNAKGILAIENGQQEAITSLQKILADSKKIKIIPMKRKYPQDMERMLIYTCTGKAINSSKTAEDARCIVVGSDTVSAICNAVTFGKPMYKRLITISGDCVKNPKNAEVFLGTLISDLMLEAGGLLETPDQIICGGPMTGKAMENPETVDREVSLQTVISENLNVPMTKDISAVLCLKREKTMKRSGTCIGCGYCVDVCNEQLLPVRLMKASAEGKKEQFIRLGGMECCGCGSCSYICPADLELSREICTMKKQIVSERKLGEA